MPKEYKPEKGKSMIAFNKVSKDYGKKKKPKVNRFVVFSRPIEEGIQQGDGLMIPGVRRLMRPVKPKLKLNDMFDVNGDGKPSSKDKEKKRHEQNHRQTNKPIYDYRKRI